MSSDNTWTPSAAETWPEAVFPVKDVRWQPCFRIVPGHSPTIDLFERLAEPTDWDALQWVESLTDPRIRDEVGDVEQVPREDRAFGPGSSTIMTAFTGLDPAGSRFADGMFGAFYAAASLATSIAETRYHRENFLRATQERPIELTMHSYLADVAARFHDIRRQRAHMPDIYDPHSYSTSQELGRRLKLAGSNGIAYDSVRHPGGECLAVFRPRLVQNLRQGVQLRYVWDGTRIAGVYERRQLEH